MIVSEFDPAYDLAGRIPAGAKVGIIGCADCAAAYGTGDTKRIEAVAESLAGHARIVFTASLESPCDQRAFRLFSRALDGFDEVEALVVLACEAGARSIGDRLRAEGRKVPVLSPLRTRGFAWTRTDGRAVPACLFCPDCGFPDRNGPCPVAACPAHRRDGPCQERDGDACVADGALRCPWLA